MDKTKYIEGTDIPVDSIAGEELLMRQKKIQKLQEILSKAKQSSDEPIYSNQDMLAEIDRLSDAKGLDDLLPEDDKEYERWNKERINILTECIQRRENGNLMKPESAEQIPDAIWTEVLSGV